MMFTPFQKYDDVNVIGSENICKLAEEKNINKIIFVIFLLLSMVLHLMQLMRMEK